MILLLGVVLAGCSAPAAIEKVLTQATPGPKYTSISPEQSRYLESLPEEYQRLTIPYLKQYPTPGSEITIESKVAEHSNFTSYIASYQSDGLKIYGLLTKPKTSDANQKFPAVVFLHGYIAPTVYKTTEKYVEYVDYLARNGLVVFKIDYRGNGESEGNPGGSYYSSDYVIDALNAYESLKTLADVNPAKVGLWGHSMGGNVVMRAVAARPEIPAAVIWAGAGYTYTDLAEYRINDLTYQSARQDPNRRNRQQMYELVGQVSSDSPFWSLVAATNFLVDVKTRIEIHHAVNDTVVNVGYSRGDQSWIY